LISPAVKKDILEYTKERLELQELRKKSTKWNKPQTYPAEREK
jgi:hypothetical protein